MRALASKWQVVVLTVLVVWLSWVHPLAAREKTTLSPAVLPGILAEGATALEKEISALKERGKSLKLIQEQADREAQEMRAQLFTLKASMAVKELPPKQAQEALEMVSGRVLKVDDLLKEVRREQEELAKRQEERRAAFAGLSQEMRRLETDRHPVLKARGVRQAYAGYQNLAKQYDAVATEVKGALDRRLKGLEEERQFLLEAEGQFKIYADEAWKAELLKRQTPASFRQQAAAIWETLAALPERGAAYLRHLVESGALIAFLRKKLAPLLGLLAFFLVLAVMARRIKTLLKPRWPVWRESVEDRGLKGTLTMGEIIISHLFGLGLVGWLALGMWSLGLWDNTMARLTLRGVAVVVALLVGRPLVRALFAGEAGGGLLPLDEATARFYRRHCRWLLTYSLVFGFFGLSAARRLGLDPGSHQFLAHLFQVGCLAWAWWLLRRRYLEQLLLELPGPSWLRRPGFFRALRGLILLILGIIVLTSLLGFQNLSIYLAKGAAFTAAAVVLIWLLWQGAKSLLRLVLHPESGWVVRKYPGQEALLKRHYASVLRFGVVCLSVVATFAILHLWGIPPKNLLWAFQWLTWGPTLGTVVLSPLNLGLTALTLYLGVWLSRLARVFLEVRFYPRTDWDKGVQYTISTTLHYSILVIAILAAINVLGFSLTNLALVAGALGVGIGFGLQNIVNNFVSGLILLIERPIKVGDLLIIDGQWGTVREIRLRSTIFQTADRATLIIPNSELLSTKIHNWTHYGWGINRLTLKVGVSYDADVREVTRVLDQVCRANNRVKAEPPPQVYFEAYGDSSLNFNVWIHLRTPHDRVPATHELNSAIFEAFREHGIGIPFPQRDLHIKSWPPGFVPLPPPPPEAE